MKRVQERGRRTFRNAAQEVFVTELRSSFPQSDHTGFYTDCLQLRAIELVRTSRKLFKIDIGGDSHFP